MYSSIIGVLAAALWRWLGHEPSKPSPKLTRARHWRGLVMVIFLALCAPCHGADIKEPAVAGAFYPADPDVLKAQVDGYLSKVSPMQLPKDQIALISPHAGYIYSGQVAAHGYKHLSDDYQTVILIGSSHRVPYNGASVYTQGAFRTPLGLVSVDASFAQALINPDSQVTFYPKAFEAEHSLEVQLPFLQRKLKSFKIVPILIGRATPQMHAHLADMLYKLISQGRGGKTLIVASTDLSHYYTQDQALAIDAVTLDLVRRLSPQATGEALQSKGAEMCGGDGVVLTMEVARRLKATRSIIYKHATSGDVSGDKSRVVGYLSAGIFSDPLTQKDKSQLLALAKDSIAQSVKAGAPVALKWANARLEADGAVFVTIKRHGQLRGCIGHIVPRVPLAESVISNAAASALFDRRFKPMTTDELKDMEVEISVLSPMTPIDADKIVVGRDGLYIDGAGLRGVLLPQVPVEQGWDREAYLQGICQKAGGPERCWNLPGARLYRFGADIIK